jgi:hypothetical protein
MDSQWGEVLTGIAGYDLAAKGLLAAGYAQLDVVLPAWHQPEDDNNSLVLLLLDPQ